MDVVIAALADKASVGDGLSLDGIKTSITVPSLPHTTPPMYLGCVFSFGDAERLDQTLITVDLIDPEGRPMVRLLNYDAIVVGCVDDPNAFHVAVETGPLTFSVAGDYELLVKINGVSRHTSRLLVRRSVRPE